jgi:hypothetical protein
LIVKKTIRMQIFVIIVDFLGQKGKNWSVFRKVASGNPDKKTEIWKND